jgi:predicted RNase H-like nuclease
MPEMSGQKGLKVEIVFPAAALIDLIEKPKFVKFNCKEVAADKALDQAIELVMNGMGNWQHTNLLRCSQCSGHGAWKKMVAIWNNSRAQKESDLLSLCPSLRVTNNSTRVSKESSTL